MSSPTVNRWGLNTFWYHFWYSDRYYAKHVQQDNCFIKLVQLYIYFGLYTMKNFFVNNYWYHKALKPTNYRQYFRYLIVRNKVLHTETPYRFRREPKDVFPMKVWLMRYRGWLVLNVYWFQPFKPIKGKIRFGDISGYDTFPQHAVLPRTGVRRVKTLLTILLFKHLNTQSAAYNF